MTQMKDKRCIPIKKKFVDYMSHWFSDFLFQGNTSQFYVFRRENIDGIFDYIIIQREFYEGMISIIITEVASCYNKLWKAIPYYTIGYDTDIGVLITKKNYYNADIGWHRVQNDVEQLPELFDGIRKDIDTYVMDFFSKCHKKINEDKCMSVTNSYMKTQFTILSEDDIKSIKEYLVNSNKAYSQYMKDCKKNKEKETIEWFDIIPLHPIVERWIADIQKLLNYSNLPKNIQKRLIRDTIILFKDNYNYYNLG